VCLLFHHLAKEQPVWESNPSARIERPAASPNAERAICLAAARRAALDDNEWAVEELNPNHAPHISERFYGPPWGTPPGQ
jgi:hypothetical protein